MRLALAHARAETVGLARYTGYSVPTVAFPAVMLLLPAATGPHAGALLALTSTFAGNLLIVGSIANIIVVDAAARSGTPIGWRAHARVGVPVTLLTLAIAAAYLAWRA